jgi:hypothetical protein
MANGIETKRKNTCGKVKLQLDEKRRDETWTDMTDWTLRVEQESYHSSAPFELCVQHNEIPLTWLFS